MSNDILEREKNDRPTNEGMIRGIKMNEDFISKRNFKRNGIQGRYQKWNMG